jgi:CHASE2 domain-containing sensor protein
MPKPKRRKKAQQKTIKTEATQPQRSLLKRMLMALPALLAAVILVAFFANTDSYRNVEKALLDFQMHRNMPAEESPVAIVEIRDEDYYAIFGGQSPLNPTKLNQLISAIAKGQPCVIGVDISTYDRPFKEMEIPESWPPVIWVRDIVEESLSVNDQPAPKAVLGGKDAAYNREAGLTLLIKDDQGVVRRYRRLIETTEGRLPSFPWAVYQQSKNSCPGIAAPNLAESTDVLTINYSRGQEGIRRTRIPASHVLELANSVEELEKELKGKIVLLGGNYGGQDLHDTPLGRMPGVVNMANAIETELRGGGWPQPPILLLVFLILFEGIAVVLLFDEKYSLKRALLLSVPMILIVALVCSLATYGSLTYFPYFALIMVGVLIYELMDRIKGQIKDYFKKLLRRGWAQEEKDS